MAVLVLAWAVVGMHSMGSGHHGAAAAGHVSHAVAAVVDGPHDHQVMTRAGSRHIPAGGVVSAAETVARSEVMTRCLECLAPGEQTLGAMCLAVLSSLVALVLLLALRQLFHGRVGLLPRALVRALGATGPPRRRLALSPIEVCVLRT